MRLDHVFVMCDVGAPEAEALIALGLREGSPNAHPGQGTACRRFFFEDVYLELLWVADESEARSPIVEKTRLWDRWQGRHRPGSPFGLVLRADADDASLPWATWAYRPPWLGGGASIAFAECESLGEPAIIVLPASRAPASSQPVTHRLPIRRLAALSCGCADVRELSDAGRALARLGLVTYESSSVPELRMRFVGSGAGTADLRPALPLVLSW